MTICYNFASRSRPEKFFKAIDNIIENVTHPDYFILVVADEDDETMNTQAIRDRLHSYGDKVFPTWGTSKSKIDAINREINQPYIPHWDIVCNHSDDMWIVEKGFDQHVINAYSEGFTGLLHCPDQMAREKLCTYSIMDRAYFARFGYIYHPDFISVYADNHAQLVAQQLGCYKFLNIKGIEHRHFVWGYGEKDELLSQTENPVNYAKDQMTFNRLKSQPIQ